MDPKKQNLSPELKDVYDRVMNTQIKPTASTPNSATPTATTPAQPTPTPVVPNSMPTASPVITPSPTTGITPPVINPLHDASTPPQPASSSTTLGDISAAPAATPASFSFSGNKMSSPNSAKTAGKRKLPKFLIPVGVIFLVIAWAVVWAVIFGLF